MLLGDRLRVAGETDMQTDQSRSYSQPSESDQGGSQEGGAITGMLKGTVSSLGDTLRNLVRSEVELAKAELKQEASQVGKAGGMIAGGGVLGLTGFTFLMWGLIYLLGRKLPMWVSASIVGSALVTIAAFLGMSGRNQLQQTDLKPEQTIDSLKESKDEVADVVSSVPDKLTPGSA